ncbi:MAG: purine-binding chemotaxis protein CheW [Chloroflexi bacterium]|nr:MAG: purine-binding chemotaxis protein CheW [Chloroflexota bacterium]
MTAALHPARLDAPRNRLAQSRKPQAVVPVPEEHLVVFTLGNERYAVDIGDLWEINTMQTITHVPRAPHFIEGVINLRGEIIPVMDLRKRLGLDARAYDRSSRIMVTQTSHNRLGLIVDSVQEVWKVSSNLIKPAAEQGALIDEAFVRGVAQKEQELIVLIDLQRLLGEDEQQTINRMEALS